MFSSALIKMIIFSYAMTVTMLLLVILTEKNSMVNGIYCYQCDSKKQQKCFDAPEKGGPPCNHKLPWCVNNKFYDENETLLQVVRSCSDTFMGNRCEMGKKDGEPYKRCFQTCETDYCNGSSNRSGTKTTAATLFLMLTSIALIFY